LKPSQDGGCTVCPGATWWKDEKLQVLIKGDDIWTGYKQGLLPHKDSQAFKQVARRDSAASILRCLTVVTR